MSKSGTKDLFELIHSMTGAEKRHFRSYAASGGKNNYEKLFTILVKQKVYDEKKLLKENQWINSLPKLKMQLYGIIMESLQLYHKGESVEEQLISILQRMKIIYQKALYNQCLRLLLKAKWIAYKNEKWQHLMEILRWETKIWMLIPIKNYHEKSSKLVKEGGTALEKSVKALSYDFFASQAFRLQGLGFARSREEIRKFELLMQHPLLQDEKNPVSFTDAIWFHYIHGKYQMLARQDMERAFDHAQKFIRLVENNHDYFFCETPHTSYSSCLEFFMEIALAAGKTPGELLPYIQKMKKIQPSTEKEREELVVRTFYVEIKLYLDHCDYDRAVRLLQSMQHKMEAAINTKNYFVEEELLLIVSAHAWYGAGNYKKSLEYINRILNFTGEKGVREDLLSIARIINLIIHFDLGNMEALSSFTASSRRYLNKKHRLYKTERIMLAHFGELATAVSKNEQREILSSLKKQLLTIQVEPFEKHSYEYFNYLEWVEKKLS